MHILIRAYTCIFIHANIYWGHSFCSTVPTPRLFPTSLRTKKVKLCSPAVLSDPQDVYII